MENSANVQEDAENIVQTTELVGHQSTIKPDLDTLNVSELISSGDPTTNGNGNASLITEMEGVIEGNVPSLETLLDDTKRKRSPSADIHDSTVASDPTNAPIIVPIQSPKLTYTPLKTGLLYDVRMRYHAKMFASYYEYIDPHPEDPRRIYRIYKLLAENGLITDPTLSGVDDIGDYFLKIPAREATKDEILTVHTEEHLNFIESTRSMTSEQLKDTTEKGDSIYFNRESAFGAKLACGGSIDACKAVVEGKVKNAFAIVRPPGHHAEPDVPGGFCLFANVSVAAQVILNEYPESVRKILILDWDVHHGNGTQKVFWDDPRVLYISLHRYDLGKFYPGTKAGDLDQVGEGKGRGFNINIPWSNGALQDGDYIYAFEKVVMPICYEFDPDFIIISAGFDAADKDLVGGCHLSPAAYGHMTHMMKSLAKGAVCAILEGGYNIEATAISALAMTQVLLGEAPGELKTKLPRSDVVEVIYEVQKQQSSFWKCMKPGFESVNVNAEVEKNYQLDDVIRSHQSSLLYNKYQFTNLPVLLERKSSSFEDQILASPGIYNAQTIVITIHDPNEVWAHTDPLTGAIKPFESLIVDPTVKLIDWSRSKGFGYIDISIPSTITGDECYSYNAGVAAQELLLYVWDNYIQYFAVKKVIFIGIGDAYVGIVHLLGHRETRDIVRASISFVRKGPLKAIVPLIDEYIIDWYYHNSLVFTPVNHPCWGVEVHSNGTTHSSSATANGNAKKPRRKFGRVIRSDRDGIDGIVEERYEEAIEFIEDSLVDEDDSEKLE